MDRRMFLGALAGGLVAAPLAADTQEGGKVWRLGVLAPGAPAAWVDNFEAFRGGLRELGWIEGWTLILDRRYADNRYDLLPALAAELVALSPELATDRNPGATSDVAKRIKLLKTRRVLRRRVSTSRQYL
jgi:putative ABC transport system substrate-binding protein